IENIVAADNANFAAPFNKIKNPRIKGLFTKYLHMKVEGKKAVFKLPKQQVQQTRQLVSRLPGGRVGAHSPVTPFPRPRGLPIEHPRLRAAPQAWGRSASATGTAASGGGSGRAHITVRAAC